MSVSELEDRVDRLIDWATTDLVSAALSAEGMAYVIVIGIPLLISLLYLRFRS